MKNQQQESPFLSQFPRKKGYIRISEQRRFAHDESAYDSQYQNEPADLAPGKGLVALVEKHQGNTQSPALEIGCGTGLLSVGLVASRLYSEVLLTDPSEAFLEITRSKLERQGLFNENVHLGVLRAEEINRLPSCFFSLVTLRSTLHHIFDYREFLHTAFNLLRPGGIIAFQEPCAEGYILMGAIAQFIPLVLEKRGIGLSKAQLQKITIFVQTMSYYARQDVDKKNAEDKHLFRIDEILIIGREHGVDFHFYNNCPFEVFAEPVHNSNKESFRIFFFNYLRYCMSFDTALTNLIEKHFGEYTDFINDKAFQDNSPSLHGVFIGIKNGHRDTSL
jgi:ubiquinone/menaquinone biosynthesis C-methylase UbiE